VDGPLTGIRVLEWAAFHNGPAAGYMLGDLGADVIKIEEPGVGDPFRGMTQMWGNTVSLPGRRVVGFEGANRNKRSIALNLSHPDSKSIFYQMIKKCDVFLTSYYRNEVLQRLGLDYETVVKHNPRIIYAINSGYGLEGTLANERGFDPIAQARSGMMWTTGDRDSNEPFLNVAAPNDSMGGTMQAFAILAALLHLNRTGEGQKLEVSLLGSALHLQYIDINALLLRGKGYSRHSRFKAANPIGNHYCCADSKWLILAEPQSDRFWGQFCKCLSKEEWQSDQRFATAIARQKNSEEICRLVADILATRNLDEWLEEFRLQKAEFAYSPILKDSDAVVDSQVQDNNYIVEFNHPVLGPTRVLPLPVKFSKSPVSIKRAAPELGEQTEEVLQEILGLTWEELAKLKEKGAIG